MKRRGQLTARQRRVLKFLADDGWILCWPNRNLRDTGGIWLGSPSSPDEDVHARTAQSLSESGLITCSKRALYVNYYQITDDGRAALRSTAMEVA